jgi:hypothetical protein
VRYLLLLFLCGCSIYVGKKEHFFWKFQDTNSIVEYNCEWKEVNWKTNWGNYYLNCE